MEIDNTKPKSAKLLEEARSEDNDLKAFGLYNRSLREKRCEVFEFEWLGRLEEYVDVEKRENGSYSFYTDDFGMIDYYPKANKLLIRKENKWGKPGLRWIVINVIGTEI